MLNRISISPETTTKRDCAWIGTHQPILNLLTSGNKVAWEEIFENLRSASYQLLFMKIVIFISSKIISLRFTLASLPVSLAHIFVIFLPFLIYWLTRPTTLAKLYKGASTDESPSVFTHNSPRPFRRKDPRSSMHTEVGSSGTCPSATVRTLDYAAPSDLPLAPTVWTRRFRPVDLADSKLLGLSLDQLTPSIAETYATRIKQAIAEANGLNPQHIDVMFADGCLLIVANYIGPDGVPVQVPVPVPNALGMGEPSSSHAPPHLLAPQPLSLVDMLPDSLRAKVTGVVHTGESPVRPIVSQVLPVVLPPGEETALTLAIEAPRGFELDGLYQPLVLSSVTGQEVQPLYYFWAQGSTPDTQEVRMVLPPLPRLECLRVGIKTTYTEKDFPAVPEGTEHAANTSSEYEAMFPEGQGTSTRHTDAWVSRRGPVVVMCSSRVPVIEMSVAEQALQLRGGVEVLEDVAEVIAHLNAMARIPTSRRPAPDATLRATVTELQHYIQSCSPTVDAPDLLAFVGGEIVPAFESNRVWDRADRLAPYDQRPLLAFKAPTAEDAFTVEFVRKYSGTVYLAFRLFFTFTVVTGHRGSLRALVTTSLWWTLPDHVLTGLAIAQFMGWVRPQRSPRTARMMIWFHAFVKVFSILFLYNRMHDVILQSLNQASSFNTRPVVKWTLVCIVLMHNWWHEMLPFKYNLFASLVGFARFAHVFVSYQAIYVDVNKDPFPAPVRVLMVACSMAVTCYGHYRLERRERRAFSVQRTHKHTVTAGGLLEAAMRQRQRQKKNR